MVCVRRFDDLDHRTCLGRPENGAPNDSLRLRDLGTQRLTVGQISPVAQPEPTATPMPTATPTTTPEPTLPPSQFNPDPGAGKE